MDKGAHFFRCDFQVHSPRAQNWVGADAITDSERRAYADELVRACRSKGLDAIAVTDHHDFTFSPTSGQPLRERLTQMEYLSRTTSS